MANTYETLRVPPFSLEAEQSVIGGLLLKPDAFSHVSSVVGESDFYRQDHRLIFRSISEVIASGGMPDILTMSEYLKTKGLLDDAGGLAYLALLANNTPSAANIKAYTEIVKEKSLLRDLVSVGTDMADDALSTAGNSLQILNDNMSKMLALSNRSQTGKKAIIPVKKGLSRALDRIQERAEGGKDDNIIPTGMPAIDGIIKGLRRGTYSLWAGRPSMGKSILGLQLASGMALSGFNVVFFSLEMPEDQVFSRLLSSNSRVLHDRIEDGNLTEDDWPKVATATNRLGQCSLYIDDTPAISPMHIRSKLNALVAETGKPIDAVVVDYLQIMSPTHTKESNENEMLTSISRELMAIPKEFNCALAVLSQLNRNCENRPKKNPVMSDLRGSGSLEQDAYVIGLLYRDEYYHKEDSDDKGIVEVNIGKNRNGKLGTARFFFKGEMQRFDDIDHVYGDRYAH